MNLLPMLIILGHLLRDENVYHPALKQSLQQILKTCSAHCLMMQDVSMELNQLARSGASAKKIGFRAFSTLVDF